MRAKTDEDIPLRIGISTCLLGENVRFDAGHKKDRYLTDILGRYFEWIPVCPELEVGMGVPREAVRLVGEVDAPRMVGVRSEKEWTQPMLDYSRERVEQLRAMNLSGYIFKSDSPSCGMERVRVYGKSGMPSKNGRGLYTDVFMKALPLVPVEEEGRLNDAKLRENFIVRVFSHHRLLVLFSKRFTVGDLVRFHTIHKFLMLAHSPKHYSLLGNVVAKAKQVPRPSLEETYGRLFMEGLQVKTSTKKNVNVLQHIMGFLRDHLADGEKADILDVVEDYRHGIIPLIVPLTLVRHYVQKHSIAYINDQVYLHPHPKELMLRNHV